MRRRGLVEHRLAERLAHGAHQPAQLLRREQPLHPLQEGARLRRAARAAGGRQPQPA